MKREQIIAVLESVRPALQAEGVAHLELFGSQARGDSGPNSDVDVLIDVIPGRKFSILDLVAVEHIVGDAVGISANAFMKRSLDDEFLRSTSNDLIRIF